MTDPKCCGACGYPVHATKESACDWCRQSADRIEALTAKLAQAERTLGKIAKHDLQKIAMTALRANWLNHHARDLALVEIAKHDTQGWALAALAELSSAMKGQDDE